MMTSSASISFFFSLSSMLLTLLARYVGNYHTPQHANIHLHSVGKRKACQSFQHLSNTLKITTRKSQRKDIGETMGQLGSCGCEGSALPLGIHSKPMKQSVYC